MASEIQSVECNLNETRAKAHEQRHDESKYDIIGSRPSDHYFRSVYWFVCLFVQSFSQQFDPISIKVGNYVIWLGLVVSPRI